MFVVYRAVDIGDATNGCYSRGARCGVCNNGELHSCRNISIKSVVGVNIDIVSVNIKNIRNVVGGRNSRLVSRIIIDIQFAVLDNDAVVIIISVPIRACRPSNRWSGISRRTASGGGSDNSLSGVAIIYCHLPEC
ncbi:MAG: hypothetical protein BWY95_01619 [Bacteroidetes bacterium ADurb.BinA104]|nr:MAG: hypothetical protein BWY95_01619 [Bacteroidetes bacterium ADurb.BinA104]